jgi:flagellar biosynthetic protein FliO
MIRRRDIPGFPCGERLNRKHHSPGPFLNRLPAARAVAALALSLVICLSAAPANAAADSTAALYVAAADSAAPDSLTPPPDTIPPWSARTSIPSFDFSEKKTAGAGNWVWMFSSILIVIGLLYLFLYLLRRFFHRPGSVLSSGGQFQILQQFHLGPKKYLVMVRVGGRVLLLGVTENSINTLLEISDETEIKDVLAGLNNAVAAKGQNFRDIYQGLIGRFKN